MPQDTPPTRPGRSVAALTLGYAHATPTASDVPRIALADPDAPGWCAAWRAPTAPTLLRLQPTELRRFHGVVRVKLSTWSQVRPLDARGLKDDGPDGILQVMDLASAPAETALQRILDLAASSLRHNLNARRPEDRLEVIVRPQPGAPPSSGRPPRVRGDPLAVRTRAMTDRRTDLERALFEELDFLFAQRDDPTNQHLSQLARRPYALQGLAKLAARLDALPAPATAETDQRRKAEIAICEAARHATGPCESHADLVGRLDALRMRWCEALTLRIYAEAKAAMTGRPRRYQRIGRPSERARS